MCFSAYGCSGNELAKSNALTIVGTTSTSVYKRRVVPVHIEMIVVDEEPFADSRVSVIKCVDIEPIAIIKIIIEYVSILFWKLTRVRLAKCYSFWLQ